MLAATTVAGVMSALSVCCAATHDDVALLQRRAGDSPPADYVPVFAIKDSTKFTLKVEKGGGWEDPQGKTRDLTPGAGDTIGSDGGEYDYSLGSWWYFKIHDSSDPSIVYGGLSVGMTWKDGQWPYLAATKVDDGCAWGNPRGVGGTWKIAYAGQKKIKSKPYSVSIQEITCEDCSPKACSKETVWSVGHDKWAADYGGSQFSQHGDSLVQKPTGAGGRLVLIAGDGVTTPLSGDSCGWAATGQWQIDVKLGHNLRDDWVETFYLAWRGQEKDGHPTKSCADYIDGQYPGVTEIDILETTWGGCKGHTTNILQFALEKPADHTVCFKDPKTEGEQWMTVGARVKSTTVEIYYQMKGGPLVKRDTFHAAAGKKHKQQLVPYLGTWCNKKVGDNACANTDAFETVYKNYRFSSDTSGDLHVLTA